MLEFHEVTECRPLPAAFEQRNKTMPIYEYRCESCGYELEAIQKISDDPLVECPSCNESSLKKLLSAAGFRLKGGGWYETDFKSKGKKNLHDSERKEGSAKKTEPAKTDLGAKEGSGANKKEASKKGSESTGRSAAR